MSENALTAARIALAFHFKWTSTLVIFPSNWNGLRSK
jgi:hypothetical protein